MENCLKRVNVPVNHSVYNRLTFKRYTFWGTHLEIHVFYFIFFLIITFITLLKIIYLIIYQLPLPFIATIYLITLLKLITYIPVAKTNKLVIMYI